MRHFYALCLMTFAHITSIILLFMQYTTLCEGSMVGAKAGKRIVDGRDRLYDAYWHLVKTRPAAEITVDMVTRQAAINRTSFYYHFKNLDSLAQETLLRSASVQPYRNLVRQLTLRERMKRVQSSPTSATQDNWRELLDDVCTAVFLSTRSGAFGTSVGNLCHVWNEALLSSQHEHPEENAAQGKAGKDSAQGKASDDATQSPADDENRAVVLSAIAHSFLSLLAQRGAEGNAMPAERFVELIYKAHIPQALAQL